MSEVFFAILSFFLSGPVSHLAGAELLSQKPEPGESRRHVQMGPHTPDHHGYGDGLHVCGKMLHACTHRPDLTGTSGGGGPLFIKHLRLEVRMHLTVFTEGTWETGTPQST